MARTNIAISHSQMLLGILLMTHSDSVSFKSAERTEGNKFMWSVIQPTLMMISIILISLALMHVRNIKDDNRKHLFTFSYNLTALVILLLALLMSGRDIF